MPRQGQCGTWGLKFSWRNNYHLGCEFQIYRGSITAVLHTCMSKTRVHRLGDLQLKIMKLLWERREATVAEVHQTVARERDLAYTTVATMLRKMEARNLVAHREEGRSFVYRAIVPSDDVTRGMADHLIERLFEGSMADMVSHLLTTHEVSREELSKLEKLIAERKKKL
ncbi:MAG: BlaI family transcriptional regulator [Verrucomicrobia bacterium]|nr:MAG: BlaI family transcriptional regulator [Verrucomicrobiota bacterium]